MLANGNPANNTNVNSVPLSLGHLHPITILNTISWSRFSDCPVVQLALITIHEVIDALATDL